MHLINWFLAALVARDALFLHLWSVYDEVIELSTQHVLPHFRECWWDHLGMDVLFSNTPAIIFGMWVIRKYKIQEYDVFGRQGR